MRTNRHADEKFRDEQGVAHRPMHLHAGDHVFHIVLGTGLLAAGLVPGRRWIHDRPALNRIGKA